MIRCEANLKNSLTSVGVTSSFLALLYEPVQGFARYPVVLFANFDNLDLPGRYPPAHSTYADLYNSCHVFGG